MARLYPLFSGSEGNSYYLGSKDAGILIDAGKNAKQIGLKLDMLGINPQAIKGILISHEHSDHVSALRVFASKYKIPAFCSPATLKELLMQNVANGKFPIYMIEQDLQIADMTIKHFKTPHDSKESIGFRIKTADDKIFSYATDFGNVTNEVRENLENSDFCVVESNHDIAMLQAGFYPYHLQKRIMSNYGHLSNDDCAKFLKYLVKNGTKRFMLAHLSKENNTIDLALQTSLCELEMAGLTRDVDYTLSIARRENLNGEKVIF